MVYNHVHGPSVVELLFELHALSGHLNTDEHIQQLLSQMADQLVLNKQLFLGKPAENVSTRL